MTDEELNALVARLDDMSDLSRDHAAGLLDLGHKVAVHQAMTAITTLRAQLAEATKLAAAGNLIALELRVTEGLVEEQRARADRAEQRVATLEAALAAQIEADAGIADSHDYGFMSMTDADMRAVTIAHAIRNQPHDRTALDRHDAKTRNKALREAAEILDDEGWLGMSKHRILALIEKPNAG